MLAAVGRAGGEPEPERPGVVGVVAERCPRSASRPAPELEREWLKRADPGLEALRDSGAGGSEPRPLPPGEPGAPELARERPPRLRKGARLRERR